VGLGIVLRRRAQPATDFEDFLQDRLTFFRQSAADGDIGRFRFGPDDVAILSHPDLVHEVLVTRRADFSKAYLTSVMHPLLTGSLLLNDSDSWLHQRRLVLPAFHQERLDEYAAVMVEEAARESRTWTVAKTRDLHHDMMRITLQIVSRALFGVDLSGEMKAAEGLATVIMDEFNRRLASPVRFPVPMPTWRTIRLLRSIRALDQVAYRAIQARRAKPDGDLLSMLTGATDEEGNPMSDREVRDASLAVFFAGHETTACLLSWTWSVLAHRPDIQEGVVDELRRELPQSGPPTAATVRRLRYMDAVLSETLRLYPPAYVFGRRALRPTVVGDASIPAGTIVLMSPWAMHRDPRFFEDPDDFRPERWLEGLASRLPKFAFFPFSGGPRRCVGSSFATMEATLVLATILPRFAVSPVGPEPSPAPSITLRPAGGMPLMVAQRPTSRAVA
jgi:cytochrome P450